MSSDGTQAAATDEVPLPPGFNPWRGRIVLLTLVHTVGTGCYMSVMAMAPVIRTDLGISAAEFGYFMSFVFGAQLITALPSGAVTDRLGVGWTLFGSMLLTSIGAAWFAMCHTFVPALGASFLIGLGYSFVNPATAKAVMRWFPANWRGTAMGLKQLGVPLGGVIGAGGGVLAAYIDWHFVMLIASGLTFGTALLWLSLTRKPNAGDGGMMGILRDLKTVMTNRNMNVICFSCMLYNTGQSSLFAYTSLFLRDAAMASQPVAAMGVAFAQGASAIGRLGYSLLSDTVFGGRRTRVVLGIILAGFISCVVAYFVNPSWPYWALLALSAAMGGTIASYAALILVMTGEAVPPRLIGSAVGYNAVAWSIGGMVGPPLFGYVLDRTGNFYGASWLVMGIVMLIGAAVMWAWHRDPPREA